MDRYLVYKHTTPNGKVYIGQTKKTIDARWQNGKGYTCHKHGWFWKAIEKYGWDNIKHEILYDDLTKELADYYEKYFIEAYQSTDKRYGYNCQTGGSRNYKYNEESKTNISNGLKKRYEEFGYPKECLEALKRGREKQSKKIIQYDLDGNKIAEYSSAYDAFLNTGISNQKINQSLRKRVKQAGGYMWRYAKDAPLKINPYKIKQPCNQYDLEGNLIKKWDDVKEADKYYSFGKRKRAFAEKCCKGGCKSAYGFMWKYEYDSCEKINPLQIGKPIIQYDKNGLFIKKWRNANEVKNVLGWNIKNACEHHSKTSFGYQWRYEDDKTPLLKIEKPHIVKRKIEQYSKDGEFIKTYNNTRDAFEKTGIKVRNIHCCLQGRNKTAGGYIWKYENEEKEIKPIYHKRHVLVAKVDIEGNILQRYETIADAAKDNDLSPNSLAHYLSGNQKALKCKRGIDFKKLTA